MERVPDGFPGAGAGEVNWTSVVGDGRLVDGVISLSNPGYNLFSISLFPIAAAHAGIPLRSLCRRLIDYALSVHVRRGNW